MIRSVKIKSYEVFADADNIIGLSILQNGLNYEQHVVRELEKFLPSSKGFADLGCNIGIHTVIAKSINPNLPIVCAEALPANTSILLRNITHNRLENVTVLPFPLADRNMILRMNECAFDACCCVDGHPQVADYPVLSAALALDSIVLPPIDFVKIDVEGFELHVFQGASRLMESRPRVIFEFCPELFDRSGVAPATLIDWFLERGYTLTVLDNRPGMRATFKASAPLLAHINATVGKIADILAEP